MSGETWSSLIDLLDGVEYQFGLITADSPRHRIAFEHCLDDLWLDEWGKRPSTTSERLTICRGLLDGAPTLIPIYGHRVMPSEPIDAGNPVLSVHQSDIIYYGANLEHYLRTEFLAVDLETPETDPRAIRFWDDLIGGSVEMPGS